MNFFITLTNVLVMLAYSVPGYLLIKSRLAGEQTISGLAALLMYVLQPCLCLNSFQKIEYTPELFGQMVLFFLICAILQIFFAAILFLIMRRRFSSNPNNRMVIVAGFAGNVGFMGIPLMHSLLPDYPEAAAFSSVFFLSMGILCWTVGSACITGDVRHMSLKRALLNPPVLALFIALPLFFTKTVLPSVIAAPIALLSEMTTPICMIILGMRFATFSPKEIFTEKSIYSAALFKLVLFPMAAFAISYFLPIPREMKAALIIMASCPTANVVLSLSELHGKGQKISSLIVLSSSVFCIVTIPLILLVLG